MPDKVLARATFSLASISEPFFTAIGRYLPMSSMLFNANMSLIGLAVTFM